MVLLNLSLACTDYAWYYYYKGRPYLDNKFFWDHAFY